MAGCCYGAPSDLPWAVTFTNPETLCPLREPLHPAQLYEALLSLGVFGLLYCLRTRKRYRRPVDAHLFFLAGLVRFVVEFFRNPGDYRGPIFWADAPDPGRGPGDRPGERRLAALVVLAEELSDAKNSLRV